MKLYNQISTVTGYNMGTATCDGETKDIPTMDAATAAETFPNIDGFLSYKNGNERRSGNHIKNGKIWLARKGWVTPAEFRQA